MYMSPRFQQIFASYYYQLNGILSLPKSEITNILKLEVDREY